MKLVSIITPVYNAELYIEKTIKSVISQTYSNWELIIVDDCSTDNTMKIVEKYCKIDDRIKLIRHQQNQGVAITRNTALAEAKGQYIAFLDGDDMWLPKKLEKQLSFMENNDYVFTYTAYQKYYSESNEKGKIIKVPAKMTYKSILYNTAIACLTVMVNREIVGNFEMPLLNHSEDQCAWQSILKKGYVGYGLNENLALYRVSSNSLTANKMEAAKRQWYVYRNHHKLSVFNSSICFVCYAIHAIIKHL